MARLEIACMVFLLIVLLRVSTTGAFGRVHQMFAAADLDVLMFI